MADRIEATTRQRMIRVAILLFLLAGAGQLALQAALPAYPEPQRGGLAGWLIANNGAIVDFEVAGRAGAAAMVDAWGDKKWLLGASIVVDVAFLYAYAALLFLFTDGLADRLRQINTAGTGIAAAILRRIALVPLLAAVCDAIENLNLVWVLQAGDTAAADIAAGFALTKFVLLGIVLVAVAIGSLWLFAAHLIRRQAI